MTARQAAAPLSRGDVVLAWLALAVAGLDLGLRDVLAAETWGDLAEIVRLAGRRA